MLGVIVSWLVGVGGKVKDAFKNTWEAVTDPIGKLMHAVLDSFNNMLTQINGIWVNQDTMMFNGSTPITTTATPPIDTFSTILAYTKYIALIMCAIAVVIMGVRFALGASDNQDGSFIINRLSLVLMSVALVSSMVTIVTFIIPNVSNTTGVLGFIQSATFPYMLLILIISLIIAVVKMAYSQKGEDVNQIVGNIMKVLVVSTLSATLFSLFAKMTDDYSKWVLGAAVGQGSQAFINNSKAAVDGMNSLPALVIFSILFGVIGVITCGIQILLMLLRALILPILIGILPLQAAADSTKIGQDAFQKTLGWIIAILLYKPAAATIYAVGNVIVKQQDDFLIGFCSLLLVAIASTFALPFLMKMLVPQVGTTADSAGTAGALAGGAVAIGAIAATGGIAAGAMAVGGASGAGAGGAMAGAVASGGSSEVAGATGAETSGASRTSGGAMTGASGTGGQSTGGTGAEASGAKTTGASGASTDSESATSGIGGMLAVFRMLLSLYFRHQLSNLTPLSTIYLSN
jgi:hypothetical protein